MEAVVVYEQVATPLTVDEPDEVDPDPFTLTEMSAGGRSSPVSSVRFQGRCEVGAASY
jgi:hypothetical protein